MCEYPPRADIAEMSDVCITGDDNYWQSGSKQPVLKLCHSRVLQSAGRGGEQPLEAGLLLPAAPGAAGERGCAGECGSCVMGEWEGWEE